MKQKVQFILVTILTIGLLLGFYYFYPHVWGEMLYPLDYQDSIKKASAEFNIDPNTICAFIYTESRFNKDSTSGAGARGLMQVMPATARGIAQELGVANFSADQLYNPDINIRFGTYYIKGLLDQYKDLGIAAAGYNAGRGRTDKWREGKGSLPKETVYFMQKIQNTKKMYDQVYGQWWAQPSVTKPNSFVKGVDNFQGFVKGLILGNK